MKRTAIILDGSAPRIGSGLRHVEVATRGRKWTTVRYWPGGSKGFYINYKFRNGEFDRVRAAAERRGF